MNFDVIQLENLLSYYPTGKPVVIRRNTSDNLRLSGILRRISAGYLIRYYEIFTYVVNIAVLVDILCSYPM